MYIAAILNYFPAMIKTVLKSALGIILLILLWQYQLIIYGVSQARGQLKVIYNSREIVDVLKDPTVADSIKYKLNLIQEIKQYSFDSLGFEVTDNYTTYFDQQDKPTLWVVTGARPFVLEPKEWYFPILGRVPYKGFFKFEKAEENYKHSLTLNPNNDWTLKTFGMLYFQQVKYEDAFELWRKQAKLNPNFQPIDYSDFGDFYLSIGEYPKSKVFISIYLSFIA